MKIFAILVFALLSSLTHAQTVHPECAFTASDHDGDGWGYENDNSCVITDNSSSNMLASAGLCIDSNGDGWGWNGLSTCTDIVEGPTHTDNINELEEIDNQFGTDVLFSSFARSFTAAVIHCASDSALGNAQTYYLLYDGTAYSVSGPLGQADPTVLFGAWSTGLSNIDGRILLTIIGRGSIPMIIGNSEVRHEAGRVCSWLTP